MLFLLASYWIIFEDLHFQVLCLWQDLIYIFFRRFYFGGKIFQTEYEMKSLFMKICLKMFWDLGEALEEIYEIENVDSEDIMEEDSPTTMDNKDSLDIMMEDSSNVIFRRKTTELRRGLQSMCS